MSKKSLAVLMIVLCIGWIVFGCHKKTLKEEPRTIAGELSAAERAKAILEAEREKAKREAAQREREAKAREARLKEEEAKREFERSLIAKRTPGIEGEVFETKLLKDVHFDFDEYDIHPEDASILKENAAVLARQKSVKVQIEGHCDERGTVEYNLALGERRTSSAKNYLISLGIPTDRISTISYGKEKPLDPAHTEDAWAKNRRAHFVILSK